MGWMATILNFVCGLGGYSACSALSTYEAIVLGGVTLGVLYTWSPRRNGCAHRSR